MVKGKEKWLLDRFIEKQKGLARQHGQGRMPEPVQRSSAATIIPIRLPLMEVKDTAVMKREELPPKKFRVQVQRGKRTFGAGKSGRR